MALEGKHIALLTHGSRGDVQPNVALYHALAAEGARVTMVALKDHTDFVKEHNVDNFLPFATTARELFAILEEMVCGESEESLAEMMARMEEGAADRMLADTPTLLQACVEQKQDLIVTHPTLMPLAVAMGEKTDTQVVSMSFVPWRTTGQHPPPTHAGDFHPGKEESLKMWETITSSLMADGPRRNVNRFRATLDLPAVTEEEAAGYVKRMHDRLHCIHAYSPTIHPPPSDWNADLVATTGYLVLQQDEDQFEPSPALTSFVGEIDSEEEKPIYIGFGSMVFKERMKLLGLCLSAVAEAGCRAVICQGWHLLGKPDNFSPADYGLEEGQVMFVNSVPHTWLLPRCAATVMHGGAGTTAAALRAGRPCIVVPFICDQPFWAQRVIDLGVSPSPRLHSSTLTKELLVDAIRNALTDTTMQAKAREVGAAVRAEDGNAKAVEHIAAIMK